MQLLDLFQNQYKNFIRLGLFKVKIPTKNSKLSETLWNLLHDFIPHKVNKFDYKTAEWTTKSIKPSLKKISKLIKRYHSDLTANNKEVLDIKAKTCTPLIIKSK